MGDGHESPRESQEHNPCLDSETIEDKPVNRSRADLKRKLDTNEISDNLNSYDEDDDLETKPKRMSLLFNTPKQRRDEKKKVLRLSVQKLRRIEDPEHFLRRSVLINNITKRLQREIRDEKHGEHKPHNCAYRTSFPRRASHCYEIFNNRYLSCSSLFDDTFMDASHTLVEKQTNNNLVTTFGCQGDICEPKTKHSLELGLFDYNSNNTTSHHRQCGTPPPNCHSEKQLISEIDTVFKNLICALADT